MEENQQIIDLEKKIEGLKAIKNNDMSASFKEAVQTQEIIEILEIQLAELRNTVNNPNQKGRSIHLISEDGSETITVTVTSGNPDPSKNIFSDLSPIGIRLLKSKKGDKVVFRDKTYFIL